VGQTEANPEKTLLNERQNQPRMLNMNDERPIHTAKKAAHARKPGPGGEMAMTRDRGAAKGQAIFEAPIKSAHARLGNRPDEHAQRSGTAVR